MRSMAYLGFLIWDLGNVGLGGGRMSVVSDPFTNRTRGGASDTVRPQAEPRDEDGRRWIDELDVSEGSL